MLDQINLFKIAANNMSSIKNLELIKSLIFVEKQFVMCRKCFKCSKRSRRIKIQEESVRFVLGELMKPPRRG